MAELAACGFEPVRVRAAGGSILAIRERSIEPTGGGLLLLADPPARRPRIVLQAPLLNAELPNRFLHVEIAAAQRKRFVARSAELAKLRKALEGCTR